MKPFARFYILDIDFDESEGVVQGFSSLRAEYVLELSWAGSVDMNLLDD